MSKKREAVVPRLEGLRRHWVPDQLGHPNFPDWPKPAPVEQTVLDRRDWIVEVEETRDQTMCEQLGCTHAAPEPHPSSYRRGGAPDWEALFPQLVALIVGVVVGLLISLVIAFSVFG